MLRLPGATGCGSTGPRPGGRAEASDGNPETFTRSLDAMVEAYGIPQGGTLVVIAVPVRGLVPDDAALQATRNFATRVRVVVGDTTKGRVLSSLDTLRHWRSGESVGKDAYLSAYLVVPAPVGTWSVSVVVGDTMHAAGTGRRFRAVPIVTFDGKSLELSDPILGREGSGLSWRHGTESIPLNPTNAWRTDEPVILSYELDGMTPGHDYQTRYELWKAEWRTEVSQCGHHRKRRLEWGANVGATGSRPEGTLHRRLSSGGASA